MREMHLFAGAGGGILGGMMLGHTPVCAVEINPYCRRVLRARQADGILPAEMEIHDDVTKFDGTAWRGRVDVVAGGFPCQDISVAGKGAGLAGARSGLWWEMHRIIREVGPRYVFVENVAALTSRGLDAVLGSLADLGFDAEWAMLSAADCGAPHLRKRLWIIARMADAECEHFRAEGCRANAEAKGGVQSEAQQRERVWLDVGAGCAVDAHPNADGRRQQGGEACGLRHDESGRDADRLRQAADADCERRKEQRQSCSAHAEHETAGCDSWWGAEPNVGRVANGVASRVDRLRALGNGQVAVVAALAWHLLMSRFE